MKKLCIYHGNCADGFAGAWIVKQKFGEDVLFYPGFYYGQIPDVKNKDVIIVDFSYKLDVMLGICRDANSVLVIDHHKSAIEELEGINNVMDNIELVFSTHYSGSMLAWDYFFPNEKCPVLLEHIQDRDLWQFKLNGTKEIQACVFSYPYEFSVWTKLMNKDVKDLFDEGVAISRKQSKDIKEFLEHTKHELYIDKQVVPAVNVPYTMGSDAASILALDAPFAAYYFDTGEHRVFGLRSIADTGTDVQAIAVKYGGGGHENAAGFKVPLSELDQFRIPVVIQEYETV